MKETLAVLIPCYNEESAIGKVICDFKEAIPEAAIYVYDNNSTDRTVEEARNHGAEVRREPSQGKGNVVRRMFSDIDADIYVLVDGDGTYDAPSAKAMIAMLEKERLDMVVGIREVQGATEAAYRRGHQWGNRMFNALFSTCFGNVFTDILSGYRIFSSRFVKSFPALSPGFEIETEISIHAAELKLPVAEFKTPYSSRVSGSSSKLNTYRDGWRILMTIARLYKQVHPLRFFGVIAGILAIAAFLLGIPIIATWIETGMVPRFPTAILASGVSILSAISLTVGLVLDSMCRSHLEMKRLAYLAISHDQRK